MSKDPKIPPRSHAQSDIIDFLVKNKTMTFTQLQTKLMISRPALSRHLAALLEDKTIQFEKKGREKHYRLNEKTPDIVLERRVPIFSGTYLRQFFEHLDSKQKNEQLIKTYAEIGDKLNAVFLYVILKSFERKENWLKGFDSMGLMIVTINYLISTMYESKTLPRVDSEIFSKEGFDEFLKNLKGIIPQKKIDESVKEMMNVLKKLYPNEISLLERIISGFKN